MHTAVVRCQSASDSDISCAMPFELTACEIYLEFVLDVTYVAIAIEGIHIAARHRAGARTLTELMGFAGFDGTPLEAEKLIDRRVSVRIDLWIVELIEELVESRRSSKVRAFVRDVVLAYIDQMACEPLSTRTAS